VQNKKAASRAMELSQSGFSLHYVPVHVVPSIMAGYNLFDVPLELAIFFGWYSRINKWTKKHEL